MSEDPRAEPLTAPAFGPSDELLHRAQAVLRRERRRLRALTDAQLQLTGGSSVPGALTGGDVDLHLRVEPAAFRATVDRLRAVYEVVHPEIWAESLATFGVPGEAVGIAVTPVGSEHDRRFVESWRRLRADPALLAAYNAMKREHDSPDEPAYEAAKSAFFDRLLDPDAP